MDLRCRLDHNERDWLREKAELLERFDVERREWECQLKDMQKKIEEVRCSDSTLVRWLTNVRQEHEEKCSKVLIYIYKEFCLINAF